VLLVNLLKEYQRTVNALGLTQWMAWDIDSKDGLPMGDIQARLDRWSGLMNTLGPAPAEARMAALQYDCNWMDPAERPPECTQIFQARGDIFELPESYYEIGRRANPLAFLYHPEMQPGWMSVHKGVVCCTYSEEQWADKTAGLQVTDLPVGSRWRRTLQSRLPRRRSNNRPRKLPTRLFVRVRTEGDDP
jgi:hypothetical protein